MKGRRPSPAGFASRCLQKLLAREEGGRERATKKHRDGFFFASLLGNPCRGGGGGRRIAQAEPVRVGCTRCVIARARAQMRAQQQHQHGSRETRDDAGAAVAQAPLPEWSGDWREWRTGKAAMPLFEGLGIGGEKTAVVFDFGAAFTKCGFAGEPGPRCILPSEVKGLGTSTPVKVVQYHVNTDELYQNLKDFIHVLYFRHLLVNPRDRRVVVVESMLCPTHFREAVARVFFKHFEVPSVLFAPSHLMAVLTLGINTALVMDCGYNETLVLPVCEGIPVVSAWEAMPLGGKALHRELRSMLQEGSPAEATSEPSQSPSLLPEDVLEDIKVRTCFVSDLLRGQKLQAARFPTEASAKRPTAPPDVSYPLDGENILIVKGEIRDSLCEILFVQDNEEKSVATLMLDCLVKCPMDLRTTLAKNLVVMGGTAQLPGFTHRLLAEIKQLLQQPKYQAVLSVTSVCVHTPPAKPNYVAWLGGAIFGALQEVLGSRSVSRELYGQTGKIPDWCSLGNPPPDSLLEPKTPVPMLKRAFSTDK
ncbi:LOW QUALITY PROTEIN: actin-related protein 10 [Lampetra fluviatilis]